MKVVSIINYKGGVGKTTIAANIAADLANRHNKRVLAIDIDSQSNLTFSFMEVSAWLHDFAKNHTIKNWFDAITAGAPVPSFSDLIVDRYKVDLLCSHLHLIHVDLELSGKFRGTTFDLYKHNFIKTYSLMREELDKLKEQYDVALIDCPPNLGTVTKNALVASDFYLVPFKPDFLSTVGVDVLINHIDYFVSDYNSCCQETEALPVITPVMLGGVATMFDIYAGAPTKIAKNHISILKDALEIPLFDSGLRESKAVYGAAQGAMPVVLQNVSNIVLTELKELTDEFMQKAGL